MAGRKRKQGVKRTAKGRISRAADAIIYDRGSQRTADKFSVYGVDGSDAIGRAFHHGLLGDDGLMLRNAARKLHRAYWPMLAVGREKSCLGLDIHGAAANDDLLAQGERQFKIDRERRLTDTLRKVDRMGSAIRRSFDQLVIDINPDCGPAWLDALIWVAKRNAGRKETEPRLAADPAHEQALGRALEALRDIANEW